MIEARELELQKQSIFLQIFYLYQMLLQFQKSSGLSEDSTMTMISGKYDEDNLSGHMQHSASIVEVRDQMSVVRKNIF